MKHTRLISPIVLLLGIVLSCALPGFGSAVSPLPEPGLSGVVITQDPAEPLSSLPLKPVADFTAAAGAVTKFSVFFDGRSSTGADLSYLWSFSDGFPVSSPTPVKFYDGPAVDFVTLKVANAAGSDSVTKKITVDGNGAVTVEDYPPNQQADIREPDQEVPEPYQPSPGADFQQTYADGMTLLATGDAAGAIQAFDASIALNDAFTDAYLARGLAYFQKGYLDHYAFDGGEEFLLAIDDFTRVLDENPDDVTALLGRGASWIYLGEHYSWRAYIKNATVFGYYDAAVADFNRVLDLDPENIDALNGRAYGTLVRGTGNPAVKADSELIAAAKRDVDRSIGLNPENPRAWFILGLYYDHEGLYPHAIDAFTRAMEQDPAEPWYPEWRGYEKFRDGKYASAIQDYNIAIAMHPGFAQAYNIRGMTQAMLMAEDRTRELWDFNQALAINPDISEFHRNYALALADWKRWDKSLNEHAVDQLDVALDLDPSDYRIYYDKALILTALNRNHEAVENLISFQQYALTSKEMADSYDLMAYLGWFPWYNTAWG
ncbi:MAG: tetratricopeptide repeat protein [Methanomicrobiales archaeon]|nr:tetratricopeptide repeat protein [Methanomicrobiales archaeon]